MKHTHHIIPKHAGGTDDPENLTELTVEEHAEAHRLLFEQHGRWQDRLAWLSLSGRIGKEEIIRIAQSNADKTWMKTDKGKEAFRKRQETKKKRGTDKTWNVGLTKEIDKRLEKASLDNKRNRELGLLSNIGDVMRGKPFDEKHKEKLSDIAKNRDKIICDLCGVAVIKQMYVRWHGEGKCDAAPDLESPKVCKGCGETKTLKYFGSYGKKQNGHKMYKNFCFSCENARRRNRRAST
jgi:hypothetical protein